MHLNGIHTALVTPLNQEGSVDESALVALIDYQLRSGVEGLVVAGGTGEGMALAETDWLRLLEVTAETAGGTSVVTAQVSALSTPSAVRRAERARSLGARIAMLQAPFDAPLHDDEVMRHFEAVAAVGLPVMVYNNVAAGTSLSTDLIARLAHIEGVEFLKDSSADASRMAEVQLKTDGQIEVLLGKDSFTLFGFLSGATAAVLGSANALPREFVLLHQAATVHHDIAEARRLAHALTPFVSFLERENYVAAIKAATILRGIPVGDPLPPVMPLPADKVAQLEQTLELATTAGEAPRETEGGAHHAV